MKTHKNVILLDIYICYIDYTLASSAWSRQNAKPLTVIRTVISCYDVILQYIPRNMHAVFALLCFVVVVHWLIFPYPSGLLHWHCGNLTTAPVPAKQPWWIWINTSCEFIMNDRITTTKQSTTKPCAYFLGYTVNGLHRMYLMRHEYHVGGVAVKRWPRKLSIDFIIYGISYTFSDRFCQCRQEMRIWNVSEYSRWWLKYTTIFVMHF